MLHPRFASLIKLRNAAAELPRRGLYLGTETESGAQVYLPWKWLQTHLHVIGPPGAGKTRLLLWFFQLLTRLPRATIVLVNPKGSLFTMARDWAIAQGLSERLVLFDPGDPDMVVGYNPLRPNGLPPATHAKAVREAIRSAWGQASFDQTAQLARFLYLALVAARERQLSLADAIELLRAGSALRAAVLPALEDEFVREAFEYLDSLRPARQEQLTASALARLEAFVHDPTIRRMLTAEHSLDLGEAVTKHQILLVNLELYRPLASDDVKLLGRLLVNDLVHHVFARPEQARTPVFFILDEVELFATHDLCSVLDLGREMGLHGILAHQRLGQLHEEGSYLYDSVMGCARTKVVFGGLDVRDLEVLTPETCIEEYDPMAVKDELTSLELDPIESTREVVTRGWSAGLGLAVGQGVSHGTARTTGSGTAVSSGHASGFQSGMSAGETVLADGALISSAQDFSGFTETNFTGETQIETQSTQRSRTAHRSVTKGLSGGMSVSRSRVPFYEYLKRRNVSSRTFVSQAEFLTRRLQRLKAQAQGHFAVKVPGHALAFLRGPFVQTPRVTRQLVAAGLERIFRRPFYTLRALHEAREHAAHRARPALPAASEDFYE